MLTDRLNDQIIQHLGERTGCNGWSVSGPEIESRECFIYRVTSDHYPTDIAFKIYRHNHQAAPGKVRPVFPQYAALERFEVLLNTQYSEQNEANSENEYAVPRPYGCFPEHNGFLMEWVAAPSLEERLWRYCYHRTRQQSDMRRTFHWLKHFHQQANLTQQPLNTDYYQKRLDRFIDQHAGNSLMANNPVFASGLAAIRYHANSFMGLAVNYADLHGDFTPSNILIDKQRVTAIDITARQHLPVADDLALMLSYIAIGYPNMLTRSDMKQAPATWPLLNIILDAYGYPTSTAQRRFFLFVFLYQLVRRWLVIEYRNRNRRTPLLDRWRLRNSAMIVTGVERALQESY